ncbi:MAG: hypothetical protein A3F54_03375 [Candidatus Kerfeldbacteria bacterium RIFCSPHIGHO2_12_FULL_48_17]|uniref:Uncharacterized protein n=1 Tax=Candidatus Kerfeldbacteria bacterium RIFCSPHIGHO2_12_FULL_48_17 TaxID=1798542 RepID=A0A1G2B4V7_9BACT|nr:MAG: hypothetical protein A3F54_03375 [Candidatus Kerfeldbacteria bacterium RIFCSPHIGHO2_12_FULL_48_17]
MKSKKSTPSFWKTLLSARIENKAAAEHLLYYISGTFLIIGAVYIVWYYYPGLGYSLFILGLLIVILSALLLKKHSAVASVLILLPFIIALMGYEGFNGVDIGAIIGIIFSIKSIQATFFLKKSRHII